MNFSCELFSSLYQHIDSFPGTAKNVKSAVGRQKSKALVLRKPPTTKKAVNLQIGDVTLCKMRGHPEWPCKVIGIDGNMYEVEFYGDHTSHKTIIDNFLDIKESFDVIIYHLRRRKTPLYAKSVKEAEIALHIPNEHSILHQIA